ncbi:MAG TPA: dienelactone hydrolase family protein, partial [Phycisphaerae bacterium]|nr:dienelactone hydrolase family protein [Phycisphaerae bacterium]
MNLARLFSSLLTLAVTGIAVPAALAGDGPADGDRLETSPRHHEWVDVKAPGDRTVRAFVVYPQVSGPAPGVLIIHENRGLTDWVRGVADRLAEAGYVAMAPDLLSQTGPDGGGTASYASSDAARDGIYKLPDKQVAADLDACFEYLRGLEATTDRMRTPKCAMRRR